MYAPYFVRQLLGACKSKTWEFAMTSEPSHSPAGAFVLIYVT
jgi:hypothetical protein